MLLRGCKLTPWFPSLPGCYPFYNLDPFIVTECPHVYFCGNAPRFQSKLLTGESCTCSTPSPVPVCEWGLIRLCLQGRTGSRSCW